MDERNKAYGTDEIYEAIKREDFLEKLKKTVPFIILFSIVVLFSTLGYIWWQHRHENALYKAETAYKALLTDIKEGRFSEAKRKAQEDFLKHDKGFAALASLQLAHLFQEDVRLTRSQLSMTQLKEVYAKMLQARHTIPMECFFATAQAFLAPPQADTPLSAEIQKFFMPGHSFQEVGLILQALSAYNSGNPSAIKEAFYRWEKEAAPALRWLPGYCAIGQQIPRPLPQTTKTPAQQ